ncbi:kinase-like domain-containing protein [Lineolata rhizophorae]|uniref:Autophagy-related protein 1 n=1 Tax=Lineolata rhizophorae TaxID=578093 RepID=A0A6A6PEB7_9PEZI|nr:kinase-like domain-containing protein [Lineolata rhizophorae]
MDCMRAHFQDGVLLDGRFETLSPLNHGSFGMVFMARDIYSQDFVAIKCLTKMSAVGSCPSSLAVDDRSEELAIHTRIGSHPNIVNLIETFETKTHVYLVQEFCANGDLYEAIRLGRGPLETEHVRDFMLQLVNAVEYLHSKGIYHRDIKPENILLTQDGSMKLGDFGLATTDKWSYESAVGSDRYMAPEQYEPSDMGYSPAEADVWAIGICLLNILFSRNPFATPALSDPLYADFAADRQTLFDVFPTMSQDTFEVLRHCLALDPTKRSLAAVREALDRVVSFTTDDEALDEFCTVDREVIPAPPNREPLRTPSISGPQVEQNGAFPWAKALAMTPPQPIRQLSALPEAYTEDLFPNSEQSSASWFSVKPAETASINSFVDSGLGVSFKSNKDNAQADSSRLTRSRPVPISGSLPASAARPMPSMASVFGKKGDFTSKSWSDLWDEEEEEMGSRGMGAVQKSNMLSKGGFKGRVWADESEGGRDTPRAGLSEMKNPSTVNNSRNRSPESVQKIDERVSEHTGFIFEQHHSPKDVPRYSPPSKRSNFMDKWAALGDRRRAHPTPEKNAPAAANVNGSVRKRSRASSWRRNNIQGASSWFQHHNNDSGVWENGHYHYHHQQGQQGRKEGKKEWSLSKDWRQHPNHSASDLGDLEWVGGLDLHL